VTAQLILPTTRAGGGFLTPSKLSMHARTNMEVISWFLPLRFDITKCESFQKIQVSSDRKTPAGT
jgi:RNA 3'-terminal phosphate cyclase